MKVENRVFLSLTLSNLILLYCVAFLNSVISPWGICLYLPGLFFLPHFRWIDPYRGMVSLLICGFLWDHFFSHTIGFHAFLLSFLFLTFKGILHTGKQTPQQVYIFQLIINLGLALSWFVACNLIPSGLGGWHIGRFLADLILSSLMLIPVSIWHTQFSSKMIHLLTDVHRLDSSPSK